MNTTALVRFPVIFLVALLAVLMARTAWTADDAYITYRTVENFLEGRGLVWNDGERVQSYTHPLWMLLLAGGAALSGSVEATGLVLGAAFSLAAVMLFALRIAATPLLASLGLTILIFSKSFVDYATSGLENALSHFLIVLFALAMTNSEIRMANNERPRTQSIRSSLFAIRNSPFTLSLLVALAMLSRMDLVLLLGPALAAALWERRSWRTLGAAAAGFAPLAAWMLFALLYYGAPFPNTAYAKLDTGLPTGSLLRHGVFYLISAVNIDPVLMLAILAGLMTPLLRPGRPHGALALGVALYILYVVRIGGDFMAGRMLTACLLTSVIVISSLRELAVRDVWLAIVAVTLMGLTNPRAPIYSLESFGHGLGLIDRRGVTDERAFYYHATGLLLQRATTVRPNHAWVRQGLAMRESGQRVVVKGNIGLFGYYAGPDVYVVDPFALADPLLARLPMDPADDWGIGHYRRTIPNGYLETLESGENRIEDEQVAQLYDRLTLVTRGPLLTRERLAAILDLNLGRLRPLTEGYLARGRWRRSLPLEYGRWRHDGE